jgi:cobalt-zinc-cadmium efflux system outer membrane protein
MFSRVSAMCIAIATLVFVGIPSLTKAQIQQQQQIPFDLRPVAAFKDAVTGFNSDDLVRRAISTNGELAASRLDLERARGRLRQAGLLPNPIMDIGQTTGRFTGSSGEKETAIGVTVPLELGGKRARRVDLAQAELEAVEAEVADRERRLAGDVRTAYADALSALRELEVTSDINDLDQQTIKFVQARVTEGDTAPLELSLLRAEADRIRSRRILVQGRLEAAVLKLKNLAAIGVADSLQFREDLVGAGLPAPVSLNQSVTFALAVRPDLKLARLTEEIAAAGLRLQYAQNVPDLGLFGRFSASSSVFDNTPVGILRDRDKSLSFGASITLPILNRNQGATREAEASIRQARQRREFLEQVIRTEVTTAFGRYEAAKAAVDIFEQGVIQRSVENIRAVRGAYEVGAFRITDVLAEQRRQVDYQGEYIEALKEKYQALSDLNMAIAAPVNP